MDFKNVSKKNSNINTNSNDNEWEVLNDNFSEMSESNSNTSKHLDQKKQFESFRVSKKTDLLSQKSNNGFLSDFEFIEKDNEMSNAQTKSSSKEASGNNIISDLQLKADEQQREQYKEVHQKAVVELKDTAILGKKQNTWGKGDKEVRIRRNKSIDKAKILTNCAKEDTLNVYDTINYLNKSFKKEKGDFLTVFRAINSSLEAMNENSLVSKEIKVHFFEYLEIVKKYEYLQKLNNDGVLKGLEQESLKEIEPLIESLKTRLQVYAESNRIKLDGTVLGEKEEGRKYYIDDLNKWKRRISSYKGDQKKLIDDEKEQIVPISADHKDQPIISEKKEKKWTDSDRLLMREIKSENGMREAQPKSQNTQNSRKAVLTRKEAISTESDILSQKKREQLRDMNFKLYSLGEEKIAKIINGYVISDRYSSGGYTGERKKLMQAIQAVDAALEEAKRGIRKNRKVVAQLKEIKNYFDEMTNGTLVIPEGANIEICTDDSKLEEKGHSTSVILRMGAINRMTHWCNQSNTPLFSHEPIVNDVKQRLVSNCYMLAGVTEVINISPALLKSCLKDNGDGSVTVRLFDMKDGEYVPVYIKVKKTIPRIGRIGEADPLSAGALWMQMIEKACAFHGRMLGNEKGQSKGYRSLWYGLTHDFIGTLLGVDKSEKSYSPKFESSKYKLYEDVLKNGKRKVYSVGTPENRHSRGMRKGHAYALLGAKEINDTKYYIMRNPYSTQSFRYNENNEAHKLGSIPFSNHSDDTYGQFYITIDDFGNVFDSVWVNDLTERLTELEEQQKQQKNKKVNH